MHIGKSDQNIIFRLDFVSRPPHSTQMRERFDTEREMRERERKKKKKEKKAKLLTDHRRYTTLREPVSLWIEHRRRDHIGYREKYDNSHKIEPFETINDTAKRNGTKDFTYFVMRTCR